MSKVFLSFFFPKTRFSKQDNTTFHAFEHVAKRKFFFSRLFFYFLSKLCFFFFWQNQKSEHLRKKTFESVAFFTEDLLRKRRKKRPILTVFFIVDANTYLKSLVLFFLSVTFLWFQGNFFVAIIFSNFTYSVFL